MSEEMFKNIIEEYKKRTEKECYEINIIDERPEILDDKIGGTPYLPIGEEYPKDSHGNYLSLLLQINLENIDLEGYPKKGILEIFTDSECDYPCEYAIKYFSEIKEYQTEFPKIDNDMYIVTQSYKISLKKKVCYMPSNDYRFVDVMTDVINYYTNENLVDYSDLMEYIENIKNFDFLYNRKVTTVK